MASKHSKLADFTQDFLDSERVRRLARNTQVDYTRALNTVNTTQYDHRKVGQLQLSKLTSKHCHKIYEILLKEHSVRYANHLKQRFNILLKHAVRLDLLNQNPMSKVLNAKPERRERHSWQHDQVVKFIETAFTKWEWRNAGVLVYCAYEWAQRPVDIRHLKWDQLDFDREVCKITIEKTGVEIELPMEGQLKETLLEQKETFGFQELVAPHQGGDKAWKPYTRATLSLKVQAIRQAAGLPDYLTAQALRRTTIMQMFEGGADISTVKSVTGHKNLTSLNPYVKHTLAAAKTALSQRKR